MPKQQWQHQKREEAFFTDIHKREWVTEIDSDSKGIVGNTLLRVDKAKGHVNPPWLPPPKYFRYDIKRRTISFDYHQILEDTKEADRRWKENLATIAYKQHGDKMYEAIQNPSPQLLTMVGSNPAARERFIVQAAIANNPWVLGFTDVMPEKAKPFFTKRSEVAFDPFSDEGPDSDPYADDEGEDDEYQALEESIDPEALGGKKQKIPKKPKKTKPKKEALDGGSHSI